MQQLETLQDIFNNRIFKIPDYQRGYAWTSKQLEDFWGDLINLPINRDHYTGVLSLKKLDEKTWSKWNDEKWLIKDRNYKSYHIVDGQQRLTTFVIFIQSIIELVKGLPENIDKNDEQIFLGSYSIKNIKDTYILVEKPPEFIIRTYKFGYEVDNPSFEYLRYKILLEPSSGDIQETFYTMNLENAKTFFRDNLFEYYKKFDLEGIEILFKKLIQNLKFNFYELSDDFDVYVAFETMNNRGKILSNLELLKNRLIYLTTLYGNKELKSDDEFKLRKDINDAWKTIYKQLGRNKKHPLNDDDFLMAHWIMYFPYTRKKGNDYIHFLLDQKFIPQNIYFKTEVKLNTLQKFEEIRSEEDLDIDDTEPNNNIETVLRSKLRPKEIQDYVNSLKSAAVHWYNIHNPINNSDLPEREQLWIDRLNRLGIVYFRPLITASYLAKNITSEKRIQLLKALERFIFITFRLSRAFSTYRNSEFYSAARQLRNGELSIDDIIQALEERMDDWFNTDKNYGKAYYNYTYFKTYIERNFKSGGGYYNWNGLRYFLYEYEMEKVRGRGSKKIDWELFIKGEKDKVSIEHIFPQTPTNKCWKNTFEEFNKEQHKLFQGTLGNLLPLSKSINSSLQNDCFNDKKAPKINNRNEKVRQGYQDGSHSEIEVSNNETWGPTEIKNRGIKLLKFMEKRWNIKFKSTEDMISLLFLDFMEHGH